MEHGYLNTVCAYVHLNPVRANLLRLESPLAEFPWSSYPEHLKAPAKRWLWLRVERLLGAHGIPNDTRAGRKEFELRMETRRSEGEDEFWRNWALGGGAGFRKDLLSSNVEIEGTLSLRVRTAGK